MDYYLNKENALQRLVQEYRNYKSLVIAYDFDNTVYDYHGNDWQFEAVIELLHSLKAIGCYLIILAL